MFVSLLLLASVCSMTAFDDVGAHAIDQMCSELASLVGRGHNDTLLTYCRGEVMDANPNTFPVSPGLHPLAAAMPAPAQTDVRCIADRPHGLCLVDMDKFPFAPPNTQVPEPGRGVVFVIAPDESTGWTNPSIDLNRLTPNTGAKAGTFWVDSAAAQYQTWLDSNASYRVFNSQKQSESIGVRNELNITANGPQVSISLLWGRVTIPTSVFSSPTLRLSQHEFNRSLVVFGKTVSSWPGYRIIGADGSRTQFYSKMLTHCGGRAVTRPDSNHQRLTLV